MTVRRATPTKSVSVTIPLTKGRKNSMDYDSESGNSDESSNSATDTEEEAWNNGCRDVFVIDKLNNSKSNIKEHKLSSNNLYKALHDAHLLNTMQKPSKMVNQIKSKKKLKHIHFISIIFVKLVIPAGKKNRQSKTWLVKALSTQELVSLFSLKPKQKNCQSKILSRNDSGPRPLVSSPPTQKQQQASVSLDYMLIK